MQNNQSNSNKNLLVGVIIIIFGILLFINNVFIGFPNFIFSWPSILVIIGVIVGIRSSFRSIVPWIFIIVGAFAFTHRFFFSIPFYKAMILPMTIVIIGAMIISKDKKRRRTGYAEAMGQNNVHSDVHEGVPGLSPLTYDYTKEQQQHQDSSDFKPQEEYVSVNSYFAGQKIVVSSNNVKRGDITCLFGGADINMRQADFQNEVIIDILVVAGGLELKMPSNWHLKNELTSILGGVDDKRNTYNVTTDFNKRVILRGTVLMGGIEIKN